MDSYLYLMVTVLGDTDWRATWRDDLDQEGRARPVPSLPAGPVRSSLVPFPPSSISSAMFSRSRIVVSGTLKRHFSNRRRFHARLCGWSTDRPHVARSCIARPPWSAVPILLSVNRKISPYASAGLGGAVSCSLKAELAAAVCGGPGGPIGPPFHARGDTCL